MSADRDAADDSSQNKEGAKAYNDKKKGAEFVEFLRRRLILAREILAAAHKTLAI